MKETQLSHARSLNLIETAFPAYAYIIFSYSSNVYFVEVGAPK